jgi:hypothetical protein
VQSKDPRLGQLAANAVRVHADLGSVLPSWSSAPRQALARLHVLAAADLGVPEDHLGRPRVAAEDPVEDPLELGEAPSPLEVSARLDGLFRLLLAPTAAPAVVVAGVVHGELLALRAFGTADGLVARAAARLVLVDRGLDPKAVSAPEVGFAELDAAARRGAHGHGPATDHGTYDVMARGYVSGGPPGVAAWLVHCAQAVSLGAREGLAVHQLTAEPLELHAGALQVGTGPGATEGGLRSDLGGPAPQHAVPEQSVHRRPGLGDGVGHPGEVQQGAQRVGRGVGHVQQR